MRFEVLLTVYLVAGLLIAATLCGVGMYAAITGRRVSGAENRLNLLGLFSISSSGGVLGLIFAGIATFALCLTFLSRFIPH
jgi:hypothetical protein